MASDNLGELATLGGLTCFASILTTRMTWYMCCNLFGCTMHLCIVCQADFKFLFQGNPDGTSKAVEVVPNSDKLDLECFYQDLPKYMPYLSSCARENWEQFKSTNPTPLINVNSLK